MLFPGLSILSGGVVSQFCDMRNQSNLVGLGMRVALAAGFLSAVASRLGLWGKRSSGWTNFVNYTADVNSFLPRGWASSLAVASTVAEASLGVLLMLGLLTRFAAWGAAVLTMTFGIAMAYSFGVKEPLDYSVFVCSAGAALLGSMPQNPWSLDQILAKKEI